MRTLHLIPVGRSLLDQIDRGVLPTLRSALAVDELPGSVDTVRDALSQATNQDYALDLNRLGLTGVPRTASALDSSMAAEWTSVTAVAAEPRHGAVDGEAYVFIATDSDDGLRAAILAAARYQYTTIGYLHEPLTVGSLLVACTSAGFPISTWATGGRPAPRGDRWARSGGWSQTPPPRPAVVSGMWSCTCPVATKR